MQMHTPHLRKTPHNIVSLSVKIQTVASLITESYRLPYMIKYLVWVTTSLQDSSQYILAVLNNVVFWTVSTRPLTSKSSSSFNNPLMTEPKAPITIGIIFTLMFHNFFQFPSKVEVLILLFTFLQFYSVVSRDSKSTILQVIFFCCWLL